MQCRCKIQNVDANVVAYAKVENHIPLKAELIEIRVNSVLEGALAA